MATSSKKGTRKGVESLHPEVLEGREPVALHDEATDKLVNEAHKSGLTREQMIDKIRVKEESVNNEPVTLEGMLGIGTPVNFGEVTLYVPPLKVKQLPIALKRIEEISAIKGDSVDDRMGQVTATLEVIHMALVRNYPDITVEDMEDIFDLGSIEEALEVVLNLSRITVKN